jgi:hypothetical protein
MLYPKKLRLERQRVRPVVERPERDPNDGGRKARPYRSFVSDGKPYSRRAPPWVHGCSEIGVLVDADPGGQALVRREVPLVCR